MERWGVCQMNREKGKMNNKREQRAKRNIMEELT
jgi:hypothetical protein